MLVVEEQDQIGEAGEALHSESADSRSAARHFWYLCGVLAGAFLILSAAFPIAKSSAFEAYSRHIFWHAMDYHTHMAGQNCEVVVFGDSTGITGIDPLVIQRMTGMKTCNLSLPYMALSTTHTKVLDDYLAHDIPPRMIVFANHARHLRPPLFDEEPGVVDGWLLVDRLLPPAQAAGFYLRNPRLTMLFMESIWQQVFTLSNTQQLDLTKHTYLTDMQQLQQHHGFVPMATWETQERICSEQLQAPTYSADYFAELEKLYGNKNTKFMVLASPVRSCDIHVREYRNIAGMLHIQPPQVYPPSDFADAFHLNPEGASKYSVYVGDEIRASLQRARH